jgi:hypothetical protein
VLPTTDAVFGVFVCAENDGHICFDAWVVAD